jgi:antitoxin ParD1/3/4
MLTTFFGAEATIISQPVTNRFEGAAQACSCQILPKSYVPAMSTMNISLPDTLKSFVDEQVAGRGYGTSSEYVRELIRKDQDRQQLRQLLLEGASSSPSAPADAAYFASLRERVRSRKTG